MVKKRRICPGCGGPPPRDESGANLCEGCISTIYADGLAKLKKLDLIPSGKYSGNLHSRETWLCKLWNLADSAGMTPSAVQKAFADLPRPIVMAMDVTAALMTPAPAEGPHAAFVRQEGAGAQPLDAGDDDAEEDEEEDEEDEE